MSRARQLHALVRPHLSPQPLGLIGCSELMSQTRRQVGAPKDAAIEGEPNGEVWAKRLIPRPQLLCRPFMKPVDRIRQGEPIDALGPPIREQGGEIL